MIASVVGLLLLAAFFVWAIWSAATLRFVLAGILWLIAGLFTVAILSGIVRLMIRMPMLMLLHRWAAHLMAPLCLFVVTASLVLLIRHIRGPRGVFFQFFLMSIAAQATIALAVFSGYLHPFAQGAMAETKPRFLALHCLVLPGLLIAIFPAWISTVRRLRVAIVGRESAVLESEEDHGPPTDGKPGVARKPPLPRNNDNPYASPGE